MQLTEDTLNDVATLTDAAGVLSIFVDASPDRQIGEPPALEVSVRHAIKRLVEDVREQGPRERWKALCERLEELEPELGRLLSSNESGRGRALFAAISSGDVHSFHLQVPLREGVVLDQHAHVAPLVAALDGTSCVGILIVQRDGVRAIDVRLGAAEEVARYAFEPGIDRDGKAGTEGPGTNVGSNRDQFDDFIGENRHRFLKSVAERLAPVAQQHGWDPVIVSGDARLTTYIESALKKPNGRGLVHSERVLGDYASPAEVLKTFAEDLDEIRRMRELRLIEQARDASLAGGAGALGLREVLDALVQARVSHLLLEEGRTWQGQRTADGILAPAGEPPMGIDSGDLVPEPDLGERMIERALATDAKVTIIQGPAGEVLAEYDGVAACLRW